MKGFIKQAATLACFGAGLFSVLGCVHYRNLVDPCWPERYNVIARANTREMSIAQSDMGHKLDQTVWDFHFDPGTANLNAEGRERLLYMSRRLPVPDFQLWLQFPHDSTKDRDGLIAKRKDAIRTFLTANTMGANGGAYQISVHDHAVPTHPSEWNFDALQNIRTLKGRQWTFEEKSAKMFQ
jgi:hypothetical protein